MTMKKRITSFALVLLMVLSSLAVLLPVTGVKVAAVDESTTTPTEKTYTKVTTAPTDWSGEYLIVCEAKNVAFDGSLTTLDAVSNTKGVTITDGIISGDYSSYTFTIEKIKGKDGAYTIKSASGYFIGQTEKKNGLKSSQTTSYDNSIELNINSEGKVSVSIVSNNYTLKFNDASNQNRFRYYGSGQQDIQLYKPGTSSTPTEPDVPVHGGEHTYGEWTYNDTTHSHQCTIEGCKATETANHEITWTSLDANKHTGKCKCGYTTEGAHNWETDTEATNVPDGKLAQKCRVCGKKRTIDKPNTVSNTATIDFSKNGYTNQQVVESYSDKSTGINVTFSEGSKYFNTGTAIRVYANGSFTIKGGKDQIITKITITFGSSDKTNAITAGVGTFNKDTWTGSANEVVFTIDGSSGHRRIKSLEITYEVPTTEPEAPKFHSATLDIDKNIDVNFYVSVPNGYDVANLKMFFNFYGADTSVGGEPVNTEAGIAYRFTLKDVAPHLMGEKITATLKNGDTVIATLEYSINTYLDNQKKDTTLSDSTKALIESIAAYGDKAADYNNKISDSTTFTGTATADPTDMTESKPTIGTTLEGFRFKGAAVRMENNIRIRVSFENTSGAELKFFVKVGDGEETEAILSNGYVYTDLIAPSAYDTEYTIIAKNADGETVGTVSLSVNTYVCMVLKAFPAGGTLTNAQAAMRELAIAIYNYGKAAKTAIGA